MRPEGIIFDTVHVQKNPFEGSTAVINEKKLPIYFFSVSYFQHL